MDDEPDVLETLADQLSDFEGLIFDTATDYDMGYQLIRSWTYDLVILDHSVIIFHEHRISQWLKKLPRMCFILRTILSQPAGL